MDRAVEHDERSLASIAAAAIDASLAHMAVTFDAADRAHAIMTMRALLEAETELERADREGPRVA